MVPGFLGMPVPSLLVSVAAFSVPELRRSGVISLTLDRLKFPLLAGLGVDLRSRLAIEFIRAPGTGPVRMARFELDDPAPDTWWEGVHQQAALPTVFSNPDLFITAATAWEGAQRLVDAVALVGMAPLAVYGYDTGVGTAAPSTTKPAAPPDQVSFRRAGPY